MEIQAFPFGNQFPPSPPLREFVILEDENTGKDEEDNNDDRVVDIPEASSCMNSPRKDPFLLSFKDLKYDVKLRPKSRFLGFGRSTIVSPSENNDISSKSLLNNISGDAREGEIMAILGASGSGKSTLIDALANRIDKHSLKGSVTLNNEVLDPSLSKVISAYVMQDDMLFPMLTVEETLMFAAEFRLPRSLPKEKKKARVQALIDQLGLRNAANTVIGDEGHRGVSGGERRRVSIGIDIIHDPLLLFLDEPTSGLDSTSAYKVVKVLQGIAQSGSIVIMSIHQPSSRIIGLLDRLIFLSRGQTLYFGKPVNLPRFFNDFGHPVPDNANPAEFALDFIRELEETPVGTQNLVEFNKSWQALIGSSLNASNYKPRLALKDAIKRSIAQGKLVSGATTTTDPNQTYSSVPSFANPYWFEVLILFKRLVTNSRRKPEEFGTRLATIVITAVVLGTMFWQIDNTPRGIQERLGCLAIALSAIFFNCSAEAPEFIVERYIFMRETAYNAYRRSSYVIARSFFSAPSMLSFSIVFSTITFWSIGLSGGISGFFFYFLTSIASFWAGSSLVTFLAGLFPDFFLAFVVCVSICSYFLFFCGFLISRDRLPDYWLWFHYISVIKYPYEGLVQNEFVDSKCFVRGAQVFEQTPIAALPPSMQTSLLSSMGSVVGMNITGSTCLTTGSEVLQGQGITELSKWNCLLVTVAWGFVYRILFYLTLSFGSKNKRK